MINTAEVGGGGEHLRHLVTALAPLGYTGRVIVGRPGPLVDRLRAAGAPVTVLGPMGILTPLRLARLLRADRPDLLHLHGSRAGVVGTLAARRAGIGPVVYTAHAFAFRRALPAGLHWVVARMEQYTCTRADRVICLTRGDVEAARRAGVALPRATVIPNAIDPQRFPARDDRRREFGFAADTPVVGMIARLVPQKDPLLFVQVAQAIAARVPQAAFLVVGDGPLRPDLEASAGARGLALRFTVTGFRQDIPELLATMDVVILTSRWEGLPVAVLEAMAAGRAVAAFQLTGLDEVVRDGDTGVLVAGREPGRLARAVADLLADPQRRAVLGRRARAEVEARFTVAQMAAATAGVYADVLTAWGRSAR